MKLTLRHATLFHKSKHSEFYIEIKAVEAIQNRLLGGPEISTII